jgi:hypothetical protein
MKELESNTIERMAVDACSRNLTLDTFLGSRQDGTVGRKRNATIEALLASYVQPDSELLDSLFERAYDYGREIDKLSLSSELREVIISSARGSIPACIVEESLDGKVFLLQSPISQLMETNGDTSEYDWSQVACLVGISAGILSLQNFEGVEPTYTPPVLDSNTISELLSTRNAIVEQLIGRPKKLIDALLPEIETRVQYKTCRFVTEKLLPNFMGERIAKLIEAKRKNMVSYARDGGYQKYSRWAEFWENPQRSSVQRLFQEIPPEDKRQFYERASDLAQFRLVRDVLRRDIEGGSVPTDIMRFVNEYLLYCPSQTADLDGFVEFVRTQRTLLEQSSVKISGDKPETVADYRNTALKVNFVQKERGNPINTVSLPEQQSIGQPNTVELGVRTLEFLQDYQVEYPQSVVDALGILFKEYNQAFASLVDANREWNTDYQYAFLGSGNPTNFMVQIDMVGLDSEYLAKVKDMDPKVIAEDLRRKIFEVENSIADYGYLGAVGVDIKPVLDSIREQYNRPIALLATTNRKYQEMRVAEFGEPREGEMVDGEKVKDLSGFDVFWGPDEFQRYLAENEGQCDYLLYVRSSAPKTQLRNPGAREAQPLLMNLQLREIIKANAITFNVDNPNTPLGAAQRINDTKLYMPQIGMGYPVYCITDLESENFTAFLREIGNEDPVVRAKPALESYGGYGQIRGTIEPQFIRELNSAMKMRGPYVLQDEKRNSRIIDENGTEYVYIDRNYLGWSNGRVIYLGGERTLMPVSSQEARSGRVHANEDAILANISLMQS